MARGAAAAALGECPEVDVRVLTRAMLSDSDAQARAGAAKGLARRRDKATLPQLVQALEDPDPRVRLWAITAIRRITAFHFKYDAARAPEQQRDEIAFITQTLQQRSGLRR